MPPAKINGLKTGTFYEEFSEYLEKLSCASVPRLKAGILSLLR